MAQRRGDAAQVTGDKPPNEYYINGLPKRIKKLFRVPGPEIVVAKENPSHPLQGGDPGRIEQFTHGAPVREKTEQKNLPRSAREWKWIQFPPHAGSTW